MPAAVLLNERHVTVEASGDILIQTRRAVKILTDEGRKEATAAAWYYAGEKPPRIRAWLIGPSGFIKAYKKKDIADIGAFAEWALYDNLRFRAIHDENPEIGSIFAYESQSERKPLFAQDDFAFQSNLPALESRYTLTLPAGWTPSGTVFHHPPIAPVVDGSTYVWELKNLGFRESERNAPQMRSLVPSLAVDFDVSAHAAAGPQCFRTWAGVSRWYSGLISTQEQVTPDIAAKVAELTAHAKTDDDKIRAIGRYVQRMRYVEIQLSQIAGYRPHAADDVFRNQYGDCKDKANLMRTMLNAAGIPSYLVLIYAGDRTYVHKQWPSPDQFNHVIIAVRADAGVKGPVIQAPGLGSLLLFDPTAEYTPMGDLPWFEQGSYALLCAGAKGNVVQVPAVGSDTNSSDITVNATLSATADLAASVSITLRGNPADSARARHTLEPAAQFRHSLERGLYRWAPAVTLAGVEATDHFDADLFDLKLTFTSHSYAQLMQQRLLVFRPSVVGSSAPELPVASHRTDPIILRAASYQKHVTIKLPAGFAVDEMPVAAQASSDFGEFSVKFAQAPGALTMDETLRIRPITVPAANYDACKKFFDRFLGTDEQEAVLVKE